MSLSRAQIDQLIDLRITDALTRQNTADKVREVLHEMNEALFNDNDDSIQWGFIGGDIEDQTDLIAYIESQIPDVSLYQVLSDKDQPLGYAGLDSDGKINSSQLPALAITDTYVVASQVAMLALSDAETGDVAVRSDLNKSFILAGTDSSVLGDWQELLTPTDTVLSFEGRVGAITLLSADITTALGFTPEPALGNPGVTGYVLSSTTGGVRSWVAQASGGVWGSITGTLSSQTDLQTALDARVLKAGDTMTGNLTWATNTIIGLVVNSLTTTQRDAATQPVGSIIWNTTTSRFDFATASSTWKNHVRLDGDTMTGALMVPGLTIQDGSDTTKKLTWSLTGITTATTRTITAVNYSGTSVLSNGALTATRVPVASAAGLIDYSTFLFNGTSLNINSSATATGILHLGSGNSSLSAIQFTSQTAVLSPLNGQLYLTNTDQFNFKGGANFSGNTKIGGNTSVLGTTQFHIVPTSGFVGIRIDVLGGSADLLNFYNAATASIFSVNASGALTIAGGFVIADARDIFISATTGTKIGQATSKIGHWGATPILQPTTAIAAATFVPNTSLIADDSATFDGYTFGQVVKALRNTGLLA